MGYSLAGSNPARGESFYTGNGQRVLIRLLHGRYSVGYALIERDEIRTSSRSESYAYILIAVSTETWAKGQGSGRGRHYNVHSFSEENC